MHNKILNFSKKKILSSLNLFRNSPPAMEWGGLPTPLFGIVFGFLNPRDVLSAQGVCRGWRSGRAMWRQLKLNEAKPSEPIVNPVKNSLPLSLIARMWSPAILHRLDLRGCLLDGCMQLARLSNLRHLCIGGRQVTDVELAHLATLSNLRQLDLPRCHAMTDAGIAHLKNLSLRSLNLSNCNALTDQGFVHVASISSLRELNVSTCWISNTGLQHITTLNLLRLDLSYCNAITPAGLRYLESLQNLEQLDLSHCDEMVTDSGLAHLIPLQKLYSLSLRWCRGVTAAGLYHLTSILTLQHLDLEGCAEMTDDAVPHLVKLSKLQQLDVSYCSFTIYGVAYLNALPNLRVRWSDGLKVDDLDDPCEYKF